MLRRMCANQAEQQLGPDWTLQKADTPGVLDLPTWLARSLPAGARVGVDPFLHTIDGARKLQVLSESALSSVGDRLLQQQLSSGEEVGMYRHSSLSASADAAGLGLLSSLGDDFVILVLQKALDGAGHKLVPVFGGSLVDGIWSDRPPAPTVSFSVFTVVIIKQCAFSLSTCCTLCLVKVLSSVSCTTNEVPAAGKDAGAPNKAGGCQRARQAAARPRRPERWSSRWKD